MTATTEAPGMAGVHGEDGHPVTYLVLLDCPGCNVPLNGAVTFYESGLVEKFVSSPLDEDHEGHFTEAQIAEMEVRAEASATEKYNHDLATVAARQDWDDARKATNARMEEWRQIPAVYIDRKTAALQAVIEAEAHQVSAQRIYLALRGPLGRDELFG